MIPTSELITFSYPENSFYEDNLLDADDWGKNIGDGVNYNYSASSSPEEDNSSPLYLDELQYIHDYSTTSLQYDYLDSFLPGDSKMHMVENDILISDDASLSPVSPSQSPPLSPASTSCPINCGTKEGPTSILNRKQLPNIPVVQPVKQNIVPKIPINRKSNKGKTVFLPTVTNTLEAFTNKTTVTKQNPKNGVSIKNTIPIRVNNSKVSTSTSPAALGQSCFSYDSSFPILTPTIVKLENGQFYVARAIKTNANSNQNSFKIGGRRNSEGQKIESIHTTSRDMNELKKYKRQQRMVKNRESACLSRQRKKDQFKMLETRVSEISTMNDHLKEENDTLKQRIHALENENNNLREKVIGTVDFKDKFKKSSILFVIVFIFIFNSFGNSPDINEPIPYDKELLLANKQVAFHSRSLLQAENSNVDPSETPLKYYVHSHQKPYNLNLMNDLFNHIGRNKKFFKRKVKNMKFQSQEDKEGNVDCGEQFNETYIKRINNALNGLVKDQRKETDGFKSPRGLKKSRKNMIKMTTNSSLTAKIKREKSNCTHKPSRLRSSPFSKNIKYDKYKKDIPKNLTSQLAIAIQKSIDRKADTFYVVNLWKDFLILPRTNNSNSHRPKVTFMIPAFYSKHNGTSKDSNKLSMLQIDCNVIDTKLVQLNQNMVSKSLLSQLNG